jgi:hypothetical protein
MNFDNKTAAAVLREQNRVALTHTSGDMVESLRQKGVPEATINIINNELMTALPQVILALEPIFQKLENDELEFDEAVRQTIKLSAEMSLEMGARVQDKLRSVIFQPMTAIGMA